MEEEMRNLRKKMEEMKIDFSIFYGQIEETNPNQSVISEIQVKIQEINVIHVRENNKLENLRKKALQSCKNSDMTALSNMQLLFDSFTIGCVEQKILLVTKMQDIEESMRPYQNTRSKTTQNPPAKPVAPSAPVEPSAPAHLPHLPTLAHPKLLQLHPQ